MLYHFFRECLNPKVRINKMVNKPNVNYQPSPSGLTSSYQPMMNDTYLPFHRPFTALPFSRNFIFQSCIPYHNWRKFQIYGVRITGKCICDPKVESINVYSCLSGKSSPEVLSSHTGRRKLITIRRAALF